MAKPAYTISVVNKKGFKRRMLKRIAGLKITGDLVEYNTARRIATAAKGLVAVDTGKTRDYIRHEKRGGNWAVVSDRGGDRAIVAVILEYGSAYQAAQPYMAPAADLVLAARGPRAAARAIGGLLVT
jgi:hypothetical protein